MSGRKLKFRNYKPKSEDLKKEEIPLPTPPSTELEKKVEAEVSAALPAAGAGSSADASEAPDAGSILMGGAAPGEEDVVNIAPKKANWDLKRDIQKKLDALERQTQTALRDIFRQEAHARQAAGDADVLAEAVGQQEALEANDDMED